MGTVFALLLIVVMAFLDTPENFAVLTDAWLFWGYFISGIFIAGIAVFSSFYVNVPMIRQSELTSPRLLEYFRQDGRFKGCQALWILIAVLFFFFSLFHPFPPAVMVGIWVGAIGVSIDLAFIYLARVRNYLDPFAFADYILQTGEADAKSRNVERLGDQFDALTEMSLKSIRNVNFGFTDYLTGKMEKLFQRFLENRPRQEENEEEEERFNFLLCFYLQRLDLLFTESLVQRLEPLMSRLVFAAGKSAIELGKYEMSLVGVPLHFLYKFEQEAKEHELHEVALKSHLVVQEVAKELLSVPNIKQAELENVYSLILDHLEEHAKEAFKEDKKTPVEVLTDPFHRIKKYFTEGSVKDHPDAENIVAKIDLVLAEFQELERILRTIPDIPGRESEEESE